jgi:hypothetical protein
VTLLIRNLFPVRLPYLLLIHSNRTNSEITKRTTVHTKFIDELVRHDCAIFKVINDATVSCPHFCIDFL